MQIGQRESSLQWLPYLYAVSLFTAPAISWLRTIRLTWACKFATPAVKREELAFARRRSDSPRTRSHMHEVEYVDVVLN